MEVLNILNSFNSVLANYIHQGYKNYYPLLQKSQNYV